MKSCEIFLLLKIRTMATNFSPCKGSYVLNQFPSNVMFGMNGFQPVERYRAIMALLFISTLYQTTYFGLVQIVRRCRRQNNCEWKFEICFVKGRKQCGKRRKWWLPALSPFPTMFSKGSLLGSLKVGIVCWRVESTLKCCLQFVSIWTSLKCCFLVMG